MKVTYDPGADAMYIYFSADRKSSRTEVSENGIIMDYKNDKLVGIEILDASKRFSKKQLNAIHSSL